MPRLPAIIAALLLTCGASQAQTSTGTSAMGATSPLGIPGSAGASGTSVTGIPLGATEIDPGGLSPSSLNCGMNGFSPLSTSTGSGMTGTTTSTSSTFDGGGSTLSGCTSASTSVSSSGTASPLSTPGTGSSFTLNGGTVPLGSTEINSGGISPMITVPAPAIPTYSIPAPTIPTFISPTTPCAGSTATGISGPAIGAMDTVGSTIGSTGTGASTIGSPIGSTGIGPGTVGSPPGC
jgi:hypothetical protein